MRKIAVMVGSDSDFKQMLKGLIYLRDKEKQKHIEIVDVRTSSIHRNMMETLESLKYYSKLGVDCLVDGAGMANQLTGCSDAYLRYVLGDTKLTVFGVAFEGKTVDASKAAVLSITQVPGTQVIYNNFFGAEGFLMACEAACEGEMPILRIPEKKLSVVRSIDQAIEFAELKLMEKGSFNIFHFLYN